MHAHLHVQSSDIMHSCSAKLPTYTLLPSALGICGTDTLGWWAQTLRVRRLLDEKNQTLLYIAYSTRLSSSPEEGISSGRYRHAPCSAVLRIRQGVHHVSSPGRRM